MSRCSTSNQGCTPITIQLKALHTRILKMENCGKCWPHRCMYMGEEKLWFFSLTHSFGETEAEVIQKRGASAQRTQADHSRRELEVKFISRVTSVRETRCSVFIKEQRNRKPAREFSIFKYADLLEGNKDP